MSTDERDPQAQAVGRGCLLIAAILAVLVTLMVAAGPLIGIRLLSIVAGGVAASQAAASQSCIAGAPIGGGGWEPPPDAQGEQGLSGDQVALARTLWEVAFQLGYGEKGAVIIVSTAMQEASLTLDPTPDENHDLGPLQQRVLVGWYGGRPTREENARVLTDPRQAAKLFFEGKTVTSEEVAWARAAGDEPAGPAGYHIPGLKDVKDWQNLAVTVAAQRVQGSAFPDAYAKHESTARSLIASFGVPPPPNPEVAASAPQAPTGQGCQPPGPAPVMDCPGTGNPVEKGLTSDAVLVVRCGQAQFPQVKDIGGVGERPSTVDRDHQEGRGVDLMTYADFALGQQIAEWAKNNAAQLGVTYIIWNEHIWSTARAAEGWRQCGTAAASCYAGPNDTAAHRDHVHISVLGNGAIKPAIAGEAGPLRAPIDPDKYSVGARWGEVGSWARYHTGIDLRAPLGTPIYAAAAGTFEAPTGGDWAGNHCLIRHPDGSATLYAHLTNPCPSPPGTAAQSGQPIGTVGLTGRTFGPHLHFEHYPAGRGRVGNPYTTDDPYQWMLGQGVRL